VFVVVLVSPALRGRDSFPLSTYPMYAQDRGRTAELATVVGRRADGSLVRLGLRIVADTDDPLIAQSSVRRAIASGRAGAWCRAAARRLGPAGGRAGGRAGVVEVRVVRERVDVVAMARGAQPVGELVVEASCPAS
jgi:hypothetical protein